MKAIRKLLAMALVVVMVLSMSIFVFATEEIQPRSCAHDIVHRQVARCVYGGPTKCYLYYDFYEECSKCGEVFYQTTSSMGNIGHFVEEGDTYCWQCHHYGCIRVEP